MGAFTLWRSGVGSAFFLVPSGQAAPPGPLLLRDLSGREERVAPEWAEGFRITEDQARRWAKDELGQALEELRRGADEKLAALRARLEAFNREPPSPDAKVTRDVAPALLALVKDLPGVLAKSLSGDPQRVDAAREAMAGLERRLREAGLDFDERLSGFPDRLGRLREDAARERAAARAQRDAGRRGK